MTLHDLQTDFQRILLDTDCVGADWVSESAQGLSSQKRLHIYHNAYRVRLIDVLIDTFEHTATYLGDEWFQQLASLYVQTHPSTLNNIGLYGKTFPGFLAERMPDDTELSELASMDWKLRRAFDGADSTVVTLEVLQQMAAEGRDISLLQPVPTLSVTAQAFNTLEIWHAIDQDEHPPAVERLKKPVDVLIWRKGHSPHFRSLSEIESAAIACIRSGDSLESMGETLGEEFPDVDTATAVGEMLCRWVDDQLLATVR